MNFNLDALRAEKPAFLNRLPKIPVASAISGLIVAALILMTPNTLFEAFIVQTGLPSVIESAAPPLGAKARIVFALIAAVIVTIGAWVALSILLRNRSTSVGSAPEAYAVPPRRRADSHPDHPARAPLNAGDLGAPLDLVTVAPDEPEDAFADFGPADMPVFETAEQPAFPDPAEERPEPAPAAFDEIDDQGPRFAPEQPRWDESFETEPVPSMQTPEPPAFDPPFVDQPEPQSENAPKPFRAEEFEAADFAPEQTVEEPDEPVFTVPLKPRPAATQDSAPAFERPSEPAPPREDVKSELAELIDRLEAGLNHRRERLNRKVQAESPEETVSQDTDGALREALDALERLTARGA